MQHTVRRIIGGLAITLIAAACGSPESEGTTTQAADPYPDKPVEMVVGFGAGGALDLVARAVSDVATECWEQPITVLNQEGAGGTIAAGEVIASEPTGYKTYLAPVAAMAAQPHRAGTDISYGGPDDYAPVANLVYFPQVLAVRADAPYDTVEEFLAYADEHPGEITIGSGGEGTLPHLTLEALKLSTGADLTHVPFQGFSESVPAMLGGHVSGIIVTPADMVPHVEAGNAKLIGVFSADRIPTFPDSPTFRESGIDFVQDNYYFVLVPKGTPSERVEKLAEALECIVETDGFKSFAADSGAVIDYKGPDEITRQVQEDYDRFGEIIAELGL